ncbi:MAG: ABC transporter ATP-binding protein [Armatimonadota bacterium]
MTVYQRLVELSKPYRAILYTGLLMVAITTVLDTAVLTALYASLLALVTGESPQLGGMPDLFSSIPFIRNIQLPDLAQFANASNRVSLLLTLVGITVVVQFLKSASEARQSFQLTKFGNLMARRLRERLFNHLIRMAPANLESHSTGGYLSRITGDVVVLQGILGTQLAELVNAPLTVIIALSMMFGISWKLTLAALCLTPVIALLLGWAGRQIRKLAVLIQDRLAALNASLVERLGNIRIIQSFVREPFEMERVAALNTHYYKDTMRSVLLSEIIAPGIELIAVTGMLLGVIMGGLMVFQGPENGGISAEQFILFLFLAQKAGVHFKRLSRVNQVRQQANGSGARIFELLDTVPDIRDAPDAQPLPPVTGHIVFENVGFRYGDGPAVLTGLDLEVAPGEVIALVGPSGAGKTTLVNLLPRFYDPTEGRISLDGRELRSVTLDSLRLQTGIVPQETVLFEGTIYDNILYGKLEATREEVLAATKAANALEFIERLPEGFNTPVGERGARLSGGQRQRVAIARALLKNPRILILDEATSSLDTESEHLVQQALERLMENRTTFVIAHRLSTVKNATRIVVLDQGRIVEIGTHKKLLARENLYHRLYQMQFRSDVETDAAEVS